MADTFSGTLYNGSLNDYLYLVLGLESETARKGGYHLIPNIAKEEELDRLSTTENPFTDYTDDTPTLDETATTLDLRTLLPKKFMAWGSITPAAWLPIWKKYRSQGTLTQLRANPKFMMDVFKLVKNASLRQFDLLFWQGDTLAGAASPLRFYDGIIKQLTADSDGDIINVLPAGAITQLNVVDILVSFYKAIPAKFLDDPNFKIKMNTGDYTLLQLFNNDVKKSTVGVLDQMVMNLFLNKKIEHFNNLPASHIVGTHTSNSADSNLVAGVWADLNNEMSGMQLSVNEQLSKKTKYRFDGTGSANYRYGGDIVFYKPA